MLNRKDMVTPKGMTIRPLVGNSKSDDWSKRYELTMWREGEIKLFGSTSIPEQGILFDKQNAPVDKWKYPADDKRVQGQQTRLEQDPQSSHRSASPSPVPLRDGNTEGKVYKNEGTHLTFASPTNTNFVNYQNPRPHGIPQITFTPLGQSNQGGIQDIAHTIESTAHQDLPLPWEATGNSVCPQWRPCMTPYLGRKGYRKPRRTTKLTWRTNYLR